RLVDPDRAAPVLLVPALDLAPLRRDDVNLGAGRLEAVARHFEFRLLEAVGGENENALAVELRGHDVSPDVSSAPETTTQRRGGSRRGNGPRPSVIVDGDEGEVGVRHLLVMARHEAARPGLDMDLHRGAAD